ALDIHTDLRSTKQYPDEVSLLQPIKQALCDFAIVIANVEQDGAAVAGDENVTGVWFFGKFLGGAKAGFVQQGDDVDRAADGGEAVIGNDEDIRGIANFFLFQGTQQCCEVIIDGFDGSKRFRRPGGVIVLGKIGFA